MTAFYMIKRDGEHWRSKGYPLVTLCTREDVAKQMAGATDERSWMWHSEGQDHGGLLLVRWQGLDIDYGHVVRRMPLPNGDERAFDHPNRHPETWELFNGAVWWSPRRMPAWVEKRGATYPAEGYLRHLVEDYGGWDGSKAVVFRWPNAPTEPRS